MQPQTPVKSATANTATPTVSTQRRKLLGAGAAWLALPAAAQVAGQAMPPVSVAVPWPEVRAALPQAQLAGSARLRVWGFEVYDAHLWVGPGFRASQYETLPLALSLSYLRAFKGHQIAERSLKEMRALQDISRTQAANWLSAMTQIFPDVNPADRLTGMHQPGARARFWLNTQAIGQVADADFSTLFFGIWLAKASSEPALRRDLLAGVPA